MDGYLVHGLGEAGEIVDGGVSVNDVDGWVGSLPVGRDDEDGSWPLREYILLPRFEEASSRQ